MADCKACGEWFGSTSEDELCPACEKALKRLKGYAVPVRRCSFSLEEARRRESVYKCSACGNYLTVRADTLNGGRADMNYCPFCGGRVMHRGQDDE